MIYAKHTYLDSNKSRMMTMSDYGGRVGGAELDLKKMRIILNNQRPTKYPMGCGT